MENSFSVIPLFPLQVVLLPGAHIPLHVFEERYKTLIRECARDKKEFGINLVLGGRVHRIGCTAILEKILRRYPDGRLDIRVQGRKRYRLTEDYSAEDTPYFVGKIVFLEEEPAPIDPVLAVKARKMLSELLNKVYKGKEKPASFFDEERELSYQLAEYSGLDFTQRQELLECPNEHQRLEMLITHYSEILDKLSLKDKYISILKMDSSRLN